MLSTKGMNVGVGSTRKIISTGNQKLMIRKVYLNRPAYSETAYHLMLFLETAPVGGEFEGLPHNPSKPQGPKFKGQVGRVKFSRYDFDNKTLPSGVEVHRDSDILKALVRLAEAIGKRAKLDAIKAETIEDYVKKASKVLSGTEMYNFCIGGREYKSGEYINLDLFLPKFTRDESPVTTDENKDSLMKFDAENHIMKLKGSSTSKTANTESSFLPDSDSSEDAEDDEDEFGFDF